ncbi:MAG: hypothetical protein AAGG69_02300 [Pseudomonadota bacterium]
MKATVKTNAAMLINALRSAVVSKADAAILNGKVKQSTAEEQRDAEQ